MKENLSTGKVHTFPQKHSNQIYSLFLSEDQQTLFSGCYGSDLKQHSVDTLQPVGGTTNLGIGYLHGIDQKSNLLAVGGAKKFSLIQLSKIPNQGSKMFLYTHIYDIVWGREREINLSRIYVSQYYILTIQ